MEPIRISRMPWETAGRDPAFQYQIPAETQLELDEKRKRLLEDERDAFRAEGRTADAQAAQLEIDSTRGGFGTHPALTTAGEGRRPPKDTAPNPPTKSAVESGPMTIERMPWEQSATPTPAAPKGRHAFEEFPTSLETYRSPYALTPEDFRSPEKPSWRNPAAVINDYVIEAANAVLGLGKSVVDFAKPGTELAQNIQDLIDVGRRSQSLITQQAKQELEDAIEKGGWEAIRGAGGYVLKSPGLAAAQVAGSLGPVGRLIRGATLLGGARAGLGTGALIGAVGAGGDAAGNAYEMVNQSLLQQGYDPVTAHEMAVGAARRASVAPAALGGVTGMFGVERLFSGLGRGGVIRTGISEGLQEGVEEGGTQLSANVAAQRYVPGLDPMRGVVGSAALGAALGAVGGAGVGLFTGRPVDILAGRTATDGQGTPNATEPVPTYTQVETDQNKVPREVAPGIFFTPSTGLYTINEGGQPRIVGREMPRLTPESGPYDLLGAGAANVNVNQGLLPGIPMALDQNIPTAADIEQMAMGAQPGQREMFYPNGQPTYGAAAPDSRALAEARLQAEGLKPTDKRTALATQAEEALNAGAIDEDTYNQIFSLLRESKYGRVSKILTGAPRVAQTTQAQQAEAQGPQAAVPAAATVLTPEVSTTTAQLPTNVVEPGQEIQESQQAEQQAQAAEALTTLAEDTEAAEQSVAPVVVAKAKGKTPLQRRAAFGKALAAVVRAGGNYVQGRKNKKLSKAVAAGSYAQTIDALKESKSPMIRWVAERAAGLDMKVRIDNDAVEEYDRNANIVAESAAINIRILDALRAAKAELDATKGTRIPEAVSKQTLFKEGEFGLTSSTTLGSYLFNNNVFNKAGLDKHLAQMEEDIVDEEGQRRAANGSFRAVGVQGTYDPSTKTVTVTDFASDREHTVAHEILHGLTVDALRKPTPRQRVTVGKLNELYKVVKAAKVPEVVGNTTRAMTDFYGVTSLEEFVAEGLSNPDFQQRLSEIPYKKDTVWGKFTQYIAELLGVENNNAFMELIALSEELVGDQNAVQVESTTEVPVQPRAEAGARVGEEVRGAQEPAAEGQQAQVSQAEEAVAEGTVPYMRAVNQLVKEGGLKRSVATELANRLTDGFGQVRIADVQKIIDENKAAASKGDKPVYSRGQAQGGSTVAEVDSWLAPITRLWKNAPPIRTVQSVSELDPSLKAPADAKGVFYNGEVVLIADNAKSKLDALTTLFHEVVGHYGFRALVRAESTEYVRLLTELEAQNPRIRELAKAWRDNNQQTIADLKAEQGYTDTMVRALSLEEAMADMAYDALRNPGIRKVFTKSPAVRKFAQWVAKALRTFGMGELAAKVQGLTDNLDVFALMTMSQNFVENGTKNSITTAHRIPLFSRDGTTPPSEINETLQDYSVTTSKVMFDKARRGVMGLRFLRDLKDTYGNKLSGLREYAEKAFAMGARTNELLKEGSQIANRWASLGDEAEVLSKLAGAATASEIHPDIPLDKETHKSNGRSISNAHLVGAEGKINDEVETEYKQLRTIWDKLSPKAKQVYVEARDYMHKNWMSRQDLLNKNVDAVYKPLIDAAQKADNKAKVKALNKERTAYIREFGTLLAQVKGPYFPMMRFGKYYVTYKSDTYRAAEEKLNTANEALSDLYAKYDVPMTLRKEIDAAGKSLVKLGEDPSVLGLTKETKAEFAKARKAVNEAQAAINKLVKEGDKHYANEAFESELSAEKRAAELGSRVRLANEYFRELNPVTRGFIEKLSDAVTTGLPQSQAAKARESIVQIYLAALPETSALKRQLKRKGVAGFNEDMLRAFSSHTQRDAHYLSRLEFMDDMSAELQRMRSAAKTKDQDALYNEMARRHAASLNYHQSPIENGLASLAFVYQLGVSPAFLLTNMTQPWMVSMPFMSGRHNPGKVSAALAKGFADASKAATTSFAEQGMNFEMDLKKFPEDEREMLESAMKDGLLDITLEIDLGAYAKGAGKGTFSKIMRAMGVVPHQVEVVNRVMTALAAYRLEVGKGASKADATDYAKRVLDKTHVDYSATNAPYWLKPGVVPFGKLLFQYRKYQIGMLSLLGNQWRNALKGETKKVRREARRMLFGLHVNHALMTGAMGLPGIGTAFFIANLLNAAFGDDDEPFEAEAEFRKYLAESSGVEEGMVAAKGLPTLLGIDLSRTVGMGDIAAPIRLLRDDKKGRDLYTEVMMAGLGPTLGGLGPQFAEGISAMAAGDYYRAVEGLSPRFVRDMTRAVRMSDEGLTTKAGQTVFEPDEIASWDVALQALGVPSTFVTERQAAVSAVEGAKRTIADRRTELTRAYVQARTNGDSEALSEVLAQIREYNAKRSAKREPIIKPQDLLKAYKQRRQYSADVNEQGISLPRRQRALGEYGSFANVTGE